jgi:hypothetical protein
VASDSVRLVRNGRTQDLFVTALHEDADVEDAFRRVIDAAAESVAAAIRP